MAVQREIRSATVRNSDPARLPCGGFGSPSFPVELGARSNSTNLAATHRISVSLNPQEYGSLRALASSGQRSFGWVMRHAFQKFLEGQVAQFELPLETRLGRFQFGRAQQVDRTIKRLASVDWQRLGRRTAGTIHNLHPYPTRFVPQIPATLIKTLSSPGETVLDPFCGSGTTLVEAGRLGRRAVGVDSNPLAILISRVKNTRISSESGQAVRAAVAFASSLVASFWSRSTLFGKTEECVDDQIRDHCRDLGIEASAWIPSSTVLRDISDWFSRPVLTELLLIRTAIDQCHAAAARDLLSVALSSVLLQLSHQKSDTRLTKVIRDFGPREALGAWRRKVTDLQQLLAAEQDSLRWPAAELYERDARELGFLQPCSVDLVVTSPPYPNVYDYHTFHRLRLLVLGLQYANAGPLDMSLREYGRESSGNRSTFRTEISSVLNSLKRVVKPAAICVFVIGASRIRGKVRDNVSSLEAAAVEAGFRVLVSIDAGMPSTTARLQRKPGVEDGSERIVVLQNELETIQEGVS
jgi:DNA modification methylase